MNITANSTKPVLQSITIELAPEEALAVLVIAGSIGHSHLDQLLDTRLDHEQKIHLRNLSTSALWQGLREALEAHGLGNFDERDLDERERLNLVAIGVLD